MEPKQQVDWIPAHPVSGSASMRRYCEALHNALLPTDAYEIRCLLDPAGSGAGPGILGKFARYFHRNVSYPALIRRDFQGSIGHILDHSWADLFDHMPPQATRIVTVHDLIPMRFPGGLSQSQLNRFSGWISHLDQADAIIADSTYTKQEIEALLEIEPSKIHVVPCGVDLPDKRPAPGWIEEKLSSRIPRGTLRMGSIGSTIERKNLEIFPRALAAFETLTGKKATLVRTGDKLPEALAAAIRQAAGQDALIELGRLTDAELGNFYSSVDVVVVPSLYEGFGLPVIEAMAWKVPVIASAATSLPEVGGGDVLYFDPAAPDELAERLARVAGGALPAGWTEQAYRRAESFSWRASLEGILNVYEWALERKKSL